MSDLISREALLEAIRNKGYSDNPDAMFEEIMEVIEEQPTAYDVEKVVAEEENFLVNYGIPKNTAVHRKIIGIIRNGRCRP